LRKRSTTSQGMAERTRIVLLAAEDLSNQEIASRLGVHRNVVSKWRRRFLEGGVEALRDRPRSGRPQATLPAKIRKVVETVCGRPPKGYGRWSRRLLAAKLKLSVSTVGRILKDHDLHPHRLRSFNFSPDPEFGEKLLEVVGLYMSPPENAIVLCMDEKTGIQALDRTQPLLPLRSGKPTCVSNEYVRHGTRTMLAAVELETGRATTWVNKTRKAVDFVRFMDQVAAAYPDKRLCVVMDNLNTHKGKLAQDWLARHPKVTFHYTPTHASWVNLAECFFSILARQGLYQSVHRSTRELTAFLKAFVKSYNKNCGPFVWTKGPEKLKRIIELTERYQQSLHKN
jgi:transposase